MKQFFALRFAVVFILISLLVSNVAAQFVVNTTIFTPPGVSNNVGFNFEAAVVRSTGLVYVSSTGAYGADVGVIDPNTNSLTAVIALPANTAVRRFSRANQTTQLIYFIGTQTPDIVVIDGRPSSTTFNQALLPITLPNSIMSFALDETRGRLYAVTADFNAAPLQARVTVIDVNPASATFHQVLNNVLLPANALARGVAVNSVTNKIYLGVTGPGLDGVYVMDGASLSLTRINGTVGSFGVIVNESANLVYATAQGNQVNAVDGATDTALAVISVPATILAGNSPDEKMAVHSGTGRVYVLGQNIAAANKVAVIDGDRFSSTFNTVLAGIDIGRTGGGAADIVVDESLNRILATSFVDKRTAVIDGVTNTVIANILSTQIPSDIAIDPITHRAYVANQLNFVQKIDVSSATLAATIVTAAEAGVGVVNPTNHLFYLGRTVATTDVQFFNKCGASNTVTGFPHASGRYAFVAVNRNTNRIYALNSASNLAGDVVLPGFVSVIDGNSNSVIANVEVGNQPFGITLNEVTNKIYTFNAGFFSTAFPAGISVIDGATNTATNADTSAFPVTANFFGDAAVNEATNKVYFPFNPGSNIGVLDGATNVATPLPASLGPVSAIRVNKILNRVYVVSAATGLLHVLNGATDAEIATLPIGSPYQVDIFRPNIAINEKTGRVFVVNFNDDTVTVIDGTSNTIIATLPVGDGPVSVAVNELANRVYVGNRENKTISFIDGESLSVESTLTVSLQPRFLSVDAAVSRLYVSGSGTDLSGVLVVSDVDGTFDALRQAIIAATVGDPPGIRNSMLAKVDNAEAAFERGNTQAAINKLHALERQVEAQRGKRLTNAEADHIRALISAIVNSVC